MNKAILMGRLTKDPEIRYSANGTPFARYTVAINRPKRNGEEETDFFRCVSFSKNAEVSEKYLRKGMMVLVEGHLKTGSYTNREGQRVYTTDVMVERQEFCERKTDNQTNPDDASYAEDDYMDIPDGIEEELPFD